MNPEKLQLKRLEIAIKEAERFIDRAEEALARLKSDSSIALYGCSENAAAKRASMDLSKALVAVRKSPYKE